MDGNIRDVLPDCSHRVIRGNELSEGVSNLHLKIIGLILTTYILDKGNGGGGINWILHPLNPLT
jgi:hypothetical protein